MDRVIRGDCLGELKKLPDDSVDLVCTDPPYGIGFMGKEWDTFKPDVVADDVQNSKRRNGKDDFVSPAQSAARYDHTPAGARKFREWLYSISVELLRVLKPGGFAFVCIGARQDSVSAVVMAMTEAGFKTDFTSIYWTYASGFPKAANIGKVVDKRMGTPRPRIAGGAGTRGNTFPLKPETQSREARSPVAQSLNGSYGGFQPKPAVEVIIVAMKPLSEKTFVDQALKNGKGVTWLDDCRIPGAVTTNPLVRNAAGFRSSGLANQGETGGGTDSFGRFPANLLISDQAVNDDDYSRYFCLDAWADRLPDRVKQAFPFLIAPKASKREKNEGTDLSKGKYMDETRVDKEAIGANNPRNRSGQLRTGNFHPTVKPLQLMCYLVTLGSRPGDVVLDPFLGSGTTGLAAKLLNRRYVGIEREAAYVEIAEARLKGVTPFY